MVSELQRSLGTDLAAAVGAGIFAREEHLPSLIASPKFNLKAVYSRSRKSAAALIGANAELKDVDIYSDDSPAGQTLEALLARPDIDAVDLVMPIPAQPAILRQIWKAGKHVVSPECHSALSHRADAGRRFLRSRWRRRCARLAP